ncbi:MAG: hypothetical protein RJA07_292 [Bacteroidota bacterium]|jgi:hypothetical protein
MTAKLTLAFDEKVIRKAKQYASRHHTSVSALVENFLKSITDEKTLKEKSNRIEISPYIKKLSGEALGLPPESDDEIIYQETKKKHG